MRPSQVVRARLARPPELWPVIALAVAAAPLAAQAPTAGVTGVVRDTAGVPIPGAEVAARNVETGLTYAVQTGETGEYWLRGLRPGPYDVTARLLGYRSVNWTGSRLPVGQTVTLDFELPRAVLDVEGIEVVVDRPLVETTQSDVSFVLDQDRIERIPEESRRFIDLALLAPGATTAPPTVEPVAPTQVGALDSRSLAVLVDGANLVGGFSREYAGDFPLLAIQEFEVLTSSYAAEFGQAASGVINAVTRGGTNELVVESFARFRHRRLNARGHFEREKPDFDRRHWGLAAGGPIRRDRTHWFAAVERKNEDAFTTVETNGVFPSLEGTFSTPFESTLLFARVDHRLSPSHEVTLRYGGQLSDARAEVGESRTCEFFGATPVGSAEWGVDLERDMQSVLGSHGWAVSDRARNELSVSYVRATRVRSRVTDGPAMLFPSLCAGGNHFQWDRVDARLTLKEEFSFVAAGRSGTHRVKVGAQFHRVSTPNLTQNFRNGFFIFPSDTASLPFLYGRSLDDLGGSPTNGQLGVYLQDDWSPVRDLTLNLGLRYDVETNGVHRSFVSPYAASLPFVPDAPREIDKDNIAPRIGVAWDVGGLGRTVVRGGFGLFYDQMSTLPGIFEREGDPRAANVFAPATTDPGEIPIDSAAAPRVIVAVLEPEVRTPFTRQYSLGVERVLPRDVVVRMDGMVVQGRNLTVQRERNPFVGPGVRKYPEFWVITEHLNRGRSEAKMLTFQVRKRAPWGNVEFHYTLADREATTDLWFDLMPVFDTTYEFSSEFGPVAWDERHRAVFLADAELPARLEGAIKLIYASARPYTRISGEDTNGDGTLNDRPEGVGRNTERGPDFFRVDLGLRRSFAVGESEVGVSANVYNLLSRTNFKPGSVVENMNSSLFGRALAAFPERQGELGVRVRF